MKVVFAASEIAPFAKTGGLADVAGSLPLEVCRLGYEVMAFLPRYKSVNVDGDKRFELVLKQLAIPMGRDRENARLFRFKHDSGVQFYFIDQPELFCRDELYGTAAGDYPDNDHRFVFFQRGVLEALKALKIEADILHTHDWQTGLLPVYLKTAYADEPLFRKTKSIFTIHNLAYQGNFPPDSLPATGLGWELFTIDGLEFYGKVNFMKGGIVYSDAVTTVSPRYAQEIQTKEAGCGLEGVLKQRKDHIYGIINGLDYQEWNPASDPALAENYDGNQIKGKQANKEALQKEHRFKVDPKTPVVGVVSRLVDQKGIDILISAMDELAGMGIQLIVLGTGEEKYHQMLRDIAKQHRQQFGVHIVFDPALAKRIYGGCDILLIPSYYEPCGLAQMIALRYGTVPLVRAVGGLADTVEEFDSDKGTETGFLFEDYTSRALVAALKRCLQVYENPASWNKLMANGMAVDFSWGASAKKYVDLYRQTKRQPVKRH